jgi:hypothetical protein
MQSSSYMQSHLRAVNNARDLFLAFVNSVCACLAIFQSIHIANSRFRYRFHPGHTVILAAFDARMYVFPADQTMVE